MSILLYLTAGLDQVFTVGVATSVLTSFESLAGPDQLDLKYDARLKCQTVKIFTDTCIDR